MTAESLSRAGKGCLDAGLSGTCAWCRPFDRPTPRVEREARSVREILRAADLGRLTIVGSPAIEVELGWLANAEKREAVRKLVRRSAPESDPDLQARAWSVRRRLLEFRLTPMDALHIGWASSAGRDVFITTDDGVLKMGPDVERRLGLRVSGPVEFARGL